MSTFPAGRAGRVAIGALTAAIAMSMVTGAAAHADDTHTLAYIGHYSNTGLGSIVVRDGDSHEEVASIQVSGRPNGITATPDGHFIYVATENTPGVQIIDTHTNEVINEVQVGGGWANKIAFNSGGDLAYVAQGSSGAGGSRGAVHIDDVATDKVIARFKAGEWPNDIVLTPDDTHAYVASSESANVWVADLATHTIVNTIDVGASSPKLALSPDGSRLYAAAGNTLSVIDVSTNTISKQLKLTGRTSSLALSPDGTRAFVNESRAPGFMGVVTIVDTEELAAIGETAEFKVGPIAVTPDGSEVYMVSDQSTVIFEADTGEIHEIMPSFEQQRPSTVTVVAVPND